MERKSAEREEESKKTESLGTCRKHHPHSDVHEGGTMVIFSGSKSSEEESDKFKGPLTRGGKSFTSSENTIGLVGLRCDDLLALCAIPLYQVRSSVHAVFCVSMTI